MLAGAGRRRREEIDDRDAFVEAVRQALYASKVVAYAQGFDQIAAGAVAHGWNIDLGALATIWRGGCIIRARFLDRIRQAFADEPDLTTLLTHSYFRDAVADGQEGWRRVVVEAARSGIPAPGFASALAYYDGLRAERSSAALIQGLRDFFGSHTYHRVDQAGCVPHALGRGGPPGGHGPLSPSRTRLRPARCPAAAGSPARSGSRRPRGRGRRRAPR